MRFAEIRRMIGRFGTAFEFLQREPFVGSRSVDRGKQFIGMHPAGTRGKNQQSVFFQQTDRPDRET